MFKTNDIGDHVLELLRRMGRARSVDLHVAGGWGVRQVQKTLHELQAAGKVISYPYFRKERIYSLKIGSANINVPTQHIEHHSLSVQVVHALSGSRHGGDVVYENELRRTLRVGKVPDALLKFQDSNVWLEIELGRKDRSTLNQVATAAIDWCNGEEENIFVIAYPHPNLNHELRIIESLDSALEAYLEDSILEAKFVISRIVLARVEFSVGRHLVVDSLSCRRACLVGGRVALVDVDAEGSERFELRRKEADECYDDVFEIEDFFTRRIAMVGYSSQKNGWTVWVDDIASDYLLPTYWSDLPRNRIDDVAKEVIRQLTILFAGNIKALG